jgi:hypothetical protein
MPDDFFESACKINPQLIFQFLMNLLASNFQLFVMNIHMTDTLKNYAWIIYSLQEVSDEAVLFQKSFDRIHGVRAGVDCLWRY